MIVTDPVPKPPAKGAISSYPQGAASSAPPPYQVQAQPEQHTTTNALPRGRTHKRFIKALGASILVCLLFGMLSGSVDRLQRWIHSQRAGWGGDWPIPSGFNTRNCPRPADWSEMSSRDYPYSSSVSFDLPVSSDVLFLISRGSLSGGDVQIVQTQEASDVVKVDVTVDYHYPNALSRAHVCSMTRRNGENGVGIFTPRLWHTPLEDSLHFRVVAHLPASSGNSPLLIKKLTTDVPNFSHHLGQLGETVKFQTIELKGSNQAIHADSLDAENAEVVTSNAAIEGSFVTSTTLSLRTSNAPVKVAVDLHNNDAHRGTQLIMKTSNALIRSTINLLSTNSIDSQFDVDADTSNGLIDIKFPVSPVNSALFLKAMTANAPATVSLHRAYEGGFSLASSLFKPTLEKHSVIDPSGDGRPRIIEVIREGWGHLEGKVHYRPSGPAAGQVNVHTSNAGVTLKL